MITVQIRPMRFERTGRVIFDRAIVSSISFSFIATLLYRSVLFPGHIGKRAVDGAEMHREKDGGPRRLRMKHLSSLLTRRVLWMASNLNSTEECLLSSANALHKYAEVPHYCLIAPHEIVEP